MIIFIRTYTVNYRNALNRLRVRMNIILFHAKICYEDYCAVRTDTPPNQKNKTKQASLMEGVMRYSITNKDVEKHCADMYAVVHVVTRTRPV